MLTSLTDLSVTSDPPRACVAEVTSPTGARSRPELIDRRDGSVVVRCVPDEPGLHQLTVSYDDVPVKDSPWQFNVEPVTLGQLRAYGAGLTHGVATAPCQFTVCSPRDMQGTSDNTQ